MYTDPALVAMDEVTGKGTDAMGESTGGGIYGGTDAKDERVDAEMGGDTGRVWGGRAWGTDMGMCMNADMGAGTAWGRVSADEMMYAMGVGMGVEKD